MCATGLFNDHKNMGSANEQGSVQILANIRDILRDLKRLNNAIFQDIWAYNLIEIYQHSKGSSHDNVWELLPHYSCSNPQPSSLHYTLFSFLFGIIRKSATYKQPKNSALHTMKHFMPGTHTFHTSTYQRNGKHWNKWQVFHLGL